MKLRTKLSFFTMVIIISVIFVISLSLFIYEKNTRIQDIEKGQRAIFKNFVLLAQEALIVSDELLLLNNMGALKKTYNGIKYINFLSKKEELTRTLYTDRDNALRADEKKNIYKEVREVYKDKNYNKILEISNPVYIGNERIGIGQIGFSQEYYDKIISETIRKAGNRIIVIAAISLMFGLIFALILAGTITEPIKKLAGGAQSIGEGNLSTIINVKTNDEIGMLANEFNNMAVKLSELDKAKDDFVNAVSHELRTPLAAIEGYIDLLINGGTSVSEEKRKKALNIMKTSSQRLSKFIDDVLDIAKIKASMMDFKKTEHDLKNIADKVVGLLKSVAQKEEIEIKMEISGDLPRVLVDGDRINQVFTNLIGNALKFTPHHGKITVGALMVNSGNVCAFVRDTGPGISKENLNRIFGQFEQTEDTKQIRGPKGTGLGLTIAEGIVKSHDGKIWAESELGRGTVFYFTLPVSKRS